MGVMKGMFWCIVGYIAVALILIYLIIAVGRFA